MGRNPLTVKFTDTSKGSPVSWQWTFGDGTSSTLKNPSHQYTKSGTYTVALTVRDAANARSTVSKTRYIWVWAL
jgi:PKD repeat protein